jgi:hypothetical protein
MMGTDYWISVRSESGINGYSWALNDQGINGSGVVDNNGGTTWTTFSGAMPGFRINVSAVPEPSSALALIGVFGATMLRRRRI